jgi:hypothetical protein
MVVGSALSAKIEFDPLCRYVDVSILESGKTKTFVLSRVFRITDAR